MKRKNEDEALKRLKIEKLWFFLQVGLKKRKKHQEKKKKKEATIEKKKRAEENKEIEKQMN